MEKKEPANTIESLFIWGVRGSIVAIGIMGGTLLTEWQAGNKLQREMLYQQVKLLEGIHQQITQNTEQLKRNSDRLTEIERVMRHHDK